MIEYRAPAGAEAAALSDMARRAFVETFGTLYRPADLAAFLDARFGPSGLAAQVGDTLYPMRIACEGARIAGFVKLGPVALPAPAPRDAAIELHQLYVLREWHGTGVAAALMDWALAAARSAGARFVPLGVYADNRRAQRFYARYGFVEIGKATFMVGNKADDDRIYCLTL